VALAVAERDPAVVVGLVLCSLAAEPSARTRAVLKSWRHILHRGGIEAMAWAALPTVLGVTYLTQHRRVWDKLVAAVAARNRAEALHAHLDAMARYPAPTALAAHIRQPTLVISGAQDPLVSPQDAGRLAAACRGTHRLVPESGHSLPLEAPDLFNQTVDEFIEATLRGPL
jgi:pimeloyl-ACP methyl ester carboxylesterase